MKKNPKAFRHWLQKVDSFVEIAKHIIGDEEIGLRLHSALEADAAEYLEDIPAKTFGVPGGWRVLIQVLREKFDERRMHKVGSAMKSFFKLQVDRSWTLTELVDHMDKSARLCREAGLAIPDEILVYQFFEQRKLHGTSGELALEDLWRLRLEEDEDRDRAPLPHDAGLSTS